MPKSPKTRPSSTPGRTKGINCHRSQQKNLYSKDTRWYKKDPENYRVACKVVDDMKGNRLGAK